MKNRKPRYAQYEIDRMKVKDMKRLCESVGISLKGITERQEVKNIILNSDKIIIIAAPDPIEYENVSVLRSMGVGKLKRAMEDAGVFFDSKDVVEKEDMVQIFVNSGRIVFQEEEQEQDKDQGLIDDTADTIPLSSSRGNPSRKKNRYVDPYGNVYDDSDGASSNNTSSIVEGTKRARIEEDDEIMTNVSQSPSEPLFAPADVEIASDADAASADAIPHRSSSEEQITSPMENSASIDEPTAAAVTQEPEIRLHEAAPVPAPAPAPAPLPTQNERQHESPHQKFLSRSIGELRQLANSLNVDISGCIEKKEIVDLIVTAIGNGASARSR